MTAPTRVRAQAVGTLRRDLRPGTLPGVADPTAAFPARGPIGRAAGPLRRTVGVIATAEAPTGGGASPRFESAAVRTGAGMDRPRRSE
jgi:hypothetical protein